MRYALALAAALQLATPVFAQTDKVIVDVNLVSVGVSVQDEQGRAVMNLSHDDFEVFEDGEWREIRHFPSEHRRVAVGLVVDRSVSIDPVRRKLDEAVSHVLDVMNPGDEMFLTTFAGRDKLNVGMTADKGEVLKAIRKSKRDYGTRFYDAVVNAIGEVSTSNLDRRVLVVFSDGADHYSSYLRPPGS